MIVENAHCLFEQSGTFKHAFKKLGVNSKDYDILDDFNETDVRIDLFQEIKKSYYNGLSSIFDEIGHDDLILAFFPCTRFSVNNLLWFKAQTPGQRKWDIENKVLHSMNLHIELDIYYRLLCQLILVCLRKNLKLIIENPYNPNHYLARYFPIEPNFIDYDRTERGDYFIKPTQYFFFNCEPSYNMMMNSNVDNFVGYINNIDKNMLKTLNAKNVQVARSCISDDYAERFIKEFIL